MKISNGWVDTALDGHYGANSNSRGGISPKYIVLHGTAGGSSAQAIDAYFATGVQASSHFIIGQDGTVIQGISMDEAAWGNCCLSAGHADFLDVNINQNLYTISIEHVKSATDNSNDLTPAQAQASFQLINAICDAYGIPKRAGDGSGGILSHADIDPVNRSRCPGNFPWAGLWAYLNGGTMISDSGTYGPGKGDFDLWFVARPDGNWLCKQTNTVLMGGNKGLFSQLSIDGTSLPVLGLPRTNELYQSTNGVGWSVQFFERGVLVYDPNHVQDSQPGMQSSYMGKYEQFRQYDPTITITPTQTVTVTVNKIPDNVLSDLKAFKTSGDQLIKDAEQLIKDAGL